VDGPQLAAAVLLGTAYPAFAPALEADPTLAPKSWAPCPGELAAWAERQQRGSSGEQIRRSIRRKTLTERLRIGLRELLPASLGGADLEETAREVSDLADWTIQVALDEACAHVFAHLGEPRRPTGAPSRVTVLGMGKLGGRELNPGSDVDLICFYDSDECVGCDDSGRERSANEIWSAVVRRMTANLADVTEDGFAWRVDLRLRPEGASGPVVNSLGAAERYYEVFGRLWERAALLRARPVAGDAALGGELLATLAPFVWTRQVDPQIAEAMYELVHRARAELSRAPDRDLKLGPGGIREAEFFVQTLQLIWGGRDERIRDRSTIQAVFRLRSAGLVTEREARELTAAYVALRRAEHAIQLSSGIQEHCLPRHAADRERLARSLGYADGAELEAALASHMARVSALLMALLPTGTAPTTRWSDAIKALDRSDFDAFEEALSAAGMTDSRGSAGGQLARDLFAVAGHHPAGPLGARSRERFRHMVDTLLDAMADCADPTQAARYFRGFATRVRPPAVYTKLLANDAAAVRRLITVLGGSAFVGEAVATRPELADLVLFTHGVVHPDDARAEIRHAQRTPVGHRDALVEQQVGLLRRAKRRVTTQVALTDLAGDIDTRRATLTLSALADASLEAAVRYALDVSPEAPTPGLAVIAMGKLGGREIGYGSDLDVIFLYDDEGASAGDDPAGTYSRLARRIIQLVSMPHSEGPGYELDTRLRPSGSQGLLVTSLRGFARYHGVALDQRKGGEPSGARGGQAATWERLALLRARFAAGDPALGEQAIAVAHQAAYQWQGPATELAADVHHLRTRMEGELAKERAGRYDLKLGRGGLMDIELSTQLLQMMHGTDPGIRTTETRLAIEALVDRQRLTAEQGRALRDGYAFLRRLEQRLRVLHGDSAQLIEERAEGLPPLARRMGFLDLPDSDAAASLLERYRSVTSRTRAAYDQIVVATASSGAESWRRADR